MAALPTALGFDRGAIASLAASFASSSLFLSYLVEWARELKVEDLLERARRG